MGKELDEPVRMVEAAVFELMSRSGSAGLDFDCEAVLSALAGIEALQRRLAVAARAEEGGAVQALGLVDISGTLESCVESAGLEVASGGNELLLDYGAELPGLARAPGQGLRDLVEALISCAGGEVVGGVLLLQARVIHKRLRLEMRGRGRRPGRVEGRGSWRERSEGLVLRGLCEALGVELQVEAGDGRFDLLVELPLEEVSAGASVRLPRLSGRVWLLSERPAMPTLMKRWFSSAGLWLEQRRRPGGEAPRGLRLVIVDPETLEGSEGELRSWLGGLVPGVALAVLRSRGSGGRRGGLGGREAYELPLPLLPSQVFELIAELELAG